MIGTPRRGQPTTAKYPVRKTKIGDGLQTILFGSFLGVCLLFGGSSRNDVLSALPVRLGAIAVIGVSLAAIDRATMRRISLPLILIAGLAVWMLAQLIPLGPSLWASLPGREPFAAIALAAGQGGAWRPISMTPDLTLNAVLGLLPGLAALIGGARISDHGQAWLLVVLVAGTAASAMVGLAQITSGGSFYLYSQTNIGDPVGFFANRNHQAILEALALPVAFVAARIAAVSPDLRLRTAVLSAIVILFLLGMLLVGGSRAGLVLGVIGLTAAISWIGNPSSSRRVGWRWTARGGLWFLMLLAAVATLLAMAHLEGRDQAVTRLLWVNEGVDERYTLAPSVWHMTGALFPMGAGFGSFDAVYRSFQPSSLLALTHYNHAHNDLLEWIYEGGAISALLLCALLFWVGRQGVRAWRTRDHSVGRALARLGFIIILILTLASTVDYPLRTPLLSVILALSVNWLSLAADRDDKNIADSDQASP